jgi:hypothetical protein
MRPDTLGASQQIALADVGGTQDRVVDAQEYGALKTPTRTATTSTEVLHEDRQHRTLRRSTSPTNSLTASLETRQFPAKHRCSRRADHKTQQRAIESVYDKLKDKGMEIITEPSSDLFDKRKARWSFQRLGWSQMAEGMLRLSRHVILSDGRAERFPIAHGSPEEFL